MLVRDGQFAPVNERCDDPLLTTLEDPKTIELLLSVIFAKPGGGDQQQQQEEDECAYCESSLVNGISVLMALLESRRQPATVSPGMVNSASAGFSAATMFGVGAGGAAVDPSNGSEGSSTPEEAEKQQRLLDATIAAILPRVPDFTGLLRSPPGKGVLKSSAGALDPPLGITRLSKEIKFFVVASDFFSSV